MANVTNPLTPLAYLSPTVGLQLEASRYLFVGTLAAFIWDWLMSINEEYRMIRMNDRPSIPIVVYFIARIGAFGYMITTTMFQAAVVSNCNSLLVIIGIFFLIAMPAASFLFYIRVWAIYYKNRVVQGLFAVLWLFVLGSSATIPFSFKGIHIGPTQYCIDSVAPSYASATVIACAVNDTLILIVISYKLIRNNNLNSTWREQASTLFHGGGHSAVSRTLYQSGLIYYLTTIGMNILCMVVVLTPSTPPLYRAMCSPPNIALQNVMACRVFRKLKLGMIDSGDGGERGSASDHQTVPLSWRPLQVHSLGTESTGSTLVVKPRSTLDNGNDSHIMVVKVTKDVELAIDGESSDH